MRVNRFLLPIVVLVALLGTVFVAQATGLWATSGRVSVQAAQLKPEDIKGWMTLQQVIDGVPIAQDELYALANLSADVPPTTALKDLEGTISVSTLRERLSTRVKTPITSTSTRSVPGTVATPRSTATHTDSSVGTGPTPLPAGQLLPADQIKGRMTLHEVSDQCAVPFDQLLVKLKLPAETSGSTVIKDMISAGKLSDIAEVQKVVAELQNG